MKIKFILNLPKKRPNKISVMNGVVNKIRQKIRLIRLEKGYTQEYVGHLLHMSQVSYQKLENGKTELKVKTLIKIANIFEINPSSLLEEET